MRSIAFDQATDQQLKVFATNIDLTFAKNIGRDALIKKIKAVHEGDAIELPDLPSNEHERDEVEGSGRDDQTAAEDEVAKTAARRAKKQRLSGQGAEYRLIKINESELEGGNEPVDLYCNGKGIWIPRGIWVRIKVGYANALAGSAEEKFEQKKDPSTGLDIIDPTPRLVKRYSYEIREDGAQVDGPVHECNESNRQADLSKPAKSKRAA